jgi:hypothetical protein
MNREFTRTIGRSMDKLSFVGGFMFFIGYLNLSNGAFFEKKIQLSSLVVLKDTCNERNMILNFYFIL